MPGAALHTAAAASRAAVPMCAQLWRCVRANWAASNAIAARSALCTRTQHAAAAPERPKVVSKRT
jgi:hypothetical protein